MKHVMYLATHGFAVRMIFQTGLLKLLTDRGVAVTVVVPDAQDPNVVALCRRDGVTPLAYVSTARRADRAMKWLRKYVVEDIRRNPSLWDKHRRSLNKRGPAGAAAATAARLGLVLNGIVERVPPLRSGYLAVESRWLLRERAVAFVATHTPDLVVATYPVAPPEPELLVAAGAAGAGTCIHLLSWDNITAKGHFQALADKYLAWGPIMAEELREYYGVATEDISEVGVPHFDLYFKPADRPAEDELLAELSRGGPYVVFAMSAARYAPGETSILRQLCRESVPGGRFPGLRTVARPHPAALAGMMKDDRTLAELEDLRTEFGLLISLPTIVNQTDMNWSVRDSDMLHLVDLLRGAAVIINSGSTVNVEALAMGRPTVVTAYDGHLDLPYDKSARRLKDYTHLAKLFADGGGVVVGNHEELVGAIGRFLDDPEYLRPDRDYALRRQIGERGGEATDRVAEALLGMLGQPNETD